jgi:hypothetical protein
MKCPECSKQLPDIAIACRCGWTKPGSNYVGASFPLGYQQCEWESSGERCTYPGSISTNTKEGGPYYCRLHFGCRDGAYGAQIVEASRDYRHPTEAEILAEHTQRAHKSLKELGLERREGETVSAWIKRTAGYVKAKQQGVAKPLENAA